MKYIKKFIIILLLFIYACIMLVLAIGVIIKKLIIKKTKKMIKTIKNLFSPKKEKSGFEKCKELNVNDNVILTYMNDGLRYLQRGAITYYDYNAKQLAIEGRIINFEDVVTVEKH